MNASVLLLKAVQNNIDWCDAVADSHGLTTTQIGGLWLCQEPMPPLFPNVITAAPGAFNPAILHDLLVSLPTPWALKDSFHDETHVKPPYETLFNAHWYGSLQIGEGTDTSGYESLNVVTDLDDFARWLEAWGETPDGTTVYAGTILNHPDAHFVYLTDQHGICCGGSLFASQGVIGLSNLFGSTEDLQRLIRTIQLTYPNEPLVGYGPEESLTALKPFGFRDLGELSVLRRV